MKVGSFAVFFCLEEIPLALNVTSPKIVVSKIEGVHDKNKLMSKVRN